MSARDVPRIDVGVFALPLKDRLVIARALVPECAVVPREPTEAMQNAAFDAAVAALEHTSKSGRQNADAMNAACYRAMLAASEPTR